MLHRDESLRANHQTKVDGKFLNRLCCHAICLFKTTIMNQPLGTASRRGHPRVAAAKAQRSPLLEDITYFSTDGLASEAAETGVLHNGAGSYITLYST